MFWKKKNQDDLGLANDPLDKMSMPDFSNDPGRTGIPINNSQFQANDQFSQNSFNQDFGQGLDQQNRYPDPASSPLMSRVPAQQYDQPHQYDQSQQSNQNDDLELINAKLDYIKAELDAIKQRIIKIEKIAEQESVPQDLNKKKYSWY